MSTHAGDMQNPHTGLSTEVYEGWSWPCFCFGSLWYLSKGMWGVGLVWLLLSVATGSVCHWLGLLYLPSVANRQYREHLGTRGYVFHARMIADEASAARAASEQRAGYVVLGVLVALVWLATR